MVEKILSLDYKILIILFIGLLIGISIIIFFIIKYKKQLLGIVKTYEKLDSIIKVQNQILEGHKKLSIKVENIAKETIPNGVNTIRKTNDAIFEIHQMVKNQQLKLAARIEIEKSCLFECDNKGRLVTANSSFCNLFGATQDQVLGLGWGKFIHKDDIDNVLKNWDRAVKNKQHELVDVFRIIHPITKETTLVESKTIWKFDDKDEVIGTFGTIWEKKDKDRELKALECIADVAKQLKGTSLWDQIQEEVKNKKRK